MRFVLIHGGFHGAWCWERTIPELEALGHEALAIDLPGHGERAAEPAPVAAIRDAIVEVLEPGDVLVGHSGGGYAMTFAADAVPERLAHVVYFASGLPIEGRPIVEATGGAAQGDGEGVDKLMTDETGMSAMLEPQADGRLLPVDFELVWKLFYHDCDEATARWGFERLTPAPIEWILEPVSVPTFWASDLPRSAITCAQDRSQPAWHAADTADRLGVTPLVIDSSHSPFLSRPAELAALLVQATTTEPVGPLKPLRG